MGLVRSVSILAPARIFVTRPTHGRQRICRRERPVSVVATNGASFFLTGVKLEIGSIATPFNRKSLAERLADCQRYYQHDRGIISVSGCGWRA